MDDVPIVDDMTPLAAGLTPSAADRHDGRRAQEAFEAIIVEMHAQAMADQARGCGVEHPGRQAANGSREGLFPEGKPTKNRSGISTFWTTARPNETLL